MAGYLKGSVKDSPLRNFANNVFKAGWGTKVDWTDVDRGEGQRKKILLLIGVTKVDKGGQRSTGPHRVSYWSNLT